MAGIELKPCPFCGGHDIRVADICSVTFVCSCMDCGASAWVTESKDEAIKAWNTRAEMGYEDTMILLDELGAKIEQACEELGSVRIWQECYVWSHNLSCGHEVDTLDMEPPNYCPECGAKVVDA